MYFAPREIPSYDIQTIALALTYLGGFPVVTTKDLHKAVFNPDMCPSEGQINNCRNLGGGGTFGRAGDRLLMVSYAWGAAEILGGGGHLPPCTPLD